ncbi:MAG: rRNA pseudouridine synthase [Candidatus Lloydbacteria bacterium]|nr:rRNA pseudouridine synthase [Candidatus Lloydbacteria bacterium]
MRIQKYLSEKGILSRREAERALVAGRIRINGVVVKTLGTSVDPDTDRIELTQEKINRDKTAQKTFAVYKPRGIVCSQNSTEGKTVFDLSPMLKKCNLNTVGRLDKESEGLLLLSNDGTITSAITGDKHRVEKEYEVTVRERVTQSALKKMESGIKLEDGMTLPAKTKKINDHIFRITLVEGRNHQIRRMTNALRLTIGSLKRVRIGNITLNNISSGAYRELTNKEAMDLKALAFQKTKK